MSDIQIFIHFILSYYKILRMFFFTSFIFISGISLADDSIAQINAYIDEGEYMQASNQALSLESVEGYFLAADSLLIYGFCNAPIKEQTKIYKDAWNAAQLAHDLLVEQNEKDKNILSHAHILLANTMGRYSQSIGVVKALREGFAGRIENELDLALKYDPKNYRAHLSKGSWHAEIVKAAGFMAGPLYGADEESARDHYLTAIQYATEREPSILYESARGLSLIDEKDDMALMNKLLLESVNFVPNTHMDECYINLSKILIDEVTN